MKSFFKKLAFVMALAMVVSLAAPAAVKTAFAATEFTYAYQEGGKVTSLSMKAGDKVDLKFIGVKDYKNYTLVWESSNEAVATVDRNGVVTAVADTGSAVITLKVGDGTVYTSTGVTVTVGEVFDVALGTAKDNTFDAASLKVGESVDLNFYGIKDWSTSKYDCKWFSTDVTVVEVDQKGIVNALAAGTAKVTALITEKATGTILNVTPVEFTVAAEATPTPVVSTDFTVEQINTNTVQLVFNSAQTVTKDNLEFNMVVGDVLVSLPIKSIDVKDTVATVVLYSTFADATDYAFVYGDSTVVFTASVGAIDHVAFTYWTDKEGDGKAYVTTDEEECEVTLQYILYDKNNVDVTSEYDEGDFTVEYELLTDSEAYDLNDNAITFEAAGAALVKLSISWTDDDGDDVVKEATAAVKAEKRPALSHTLAVGGFIGAWYDDNDGAWEDFTENAKGYFWKNSIYSTSMVLGDDSEVQFAALVKNNRGKTVATGAAYDYGQFIFKSSNEDIFDIDEASGVLTPYDDGTASVLVYFIDANDEDQKEVFIGAVKITIKPKRYVATYQITETTKSVANCGFNGDSFVLRAYDQYGSAITLKNGYKDISVEAVSENNSVELSVSPTAENWWCDGKGGVHYHINIDGDNFTLPEKKTYQSYKYKVSVDKDENSKLTTGSTNVTVKVYDESSYYAKLMDFIDDDTTTNKPSSFYYSVSGTGSKDVVVNTMKNFSYTWNSDAVKSKSISVNYLESSNGYAMAAVPEDYIIEKGDKQTTGEVGKLYYVVSTPKDAKNYTFEQTDNKFNFTFNKADAETNTFAYATAGTYKVTLYYTTSAKTGTLKTLGTYSIVVSNSQPNPIFVDYDEDLGNKTTTDIDEDITAEEVAALAKENFVFSYDGATIDWDETTATLTTDANGFVASNGRVRVKYVYITVELDDNNEDTTYTYTKKVTVNKSISTIEE